MLLFFQKLDQRLSYKIEQSQVSALIKSYTHAKSRKTNKSFLLKTVIRRTDRQADWRADGLIVQILQDLCVWHRCNKCLGMYMHKVLNDTGYVRRSFKIKIIHTNFDTSYRSIKYQSNCSNTIQLPFIKFTQLTLTKTQ